MITGEIKILRDLWIMNPKAKLRKLNILMPPIDIQNTFAE